MLNNNFDAIAEVINGNIGGDNINSQGELTLATLSAEEQKTDRIRTLSQNVITLDDSAGVDFVRFKDTNNITIMKIYSDGKVEI